MSTSPERRGDFELLTCDVFVRHYELCRKQYLGVDNVRIIEPQILI